MKQKGRPKAALEECFSRFDQAAADPIARRRENPSQPRPAKPAIIIAQVEGSGTAAANHNPLMVIQAPACV